jgi:anti-sigma factor RsiW
VTCPTPILLSQLVDGELGAADAGEVRGHVAGCEHCAGLATRFADLTASTRIPSRMPEPSGADCLAGESIAGWVQRVLPAAELASADEHLHDCDACLDEGLAAARIMARLTEGPRLAVPETLRARVASRWTEAATAPSLTTVVVDVARAGMRLIARHVVAPIVAVDDLAGAAAAVRGDEPENVRFRICAPGAEIHAAVVPAGDVVGLTLTLMSDAGDALAGQRVFVRRQGRSIFSARTDDAGALRVQRIEVGVYEVSCPGIGTSFRLDLRR